MYTRFDRNAARKRRHLRIRSKIKGTPERPRLNVFRSNLHIYAQVIDDTKGHTIASASTLEKVFDNMEGRLTVAKAREVGRLVAERAIAHGVKKVVFDRGGYRYHGRVQALADAAREAGLEF
ncbi:50S ribosomal protein L18 [Sulfobacillus thermosulfidooxidans]|uniref:Large ribosomal subunit protein uL18 n=2 Tax=Sulfobacillus thermosulfidooxidans TaxID=28034 RepID=A0A1W1W9C1_SULTA|nr:50S ribosomal protein L18 [Sulfobacillus thermosulfidooxidans]OLZ10938.1 50S ribosomal protein L18 [Sulfobacillus thermosulfidooxidans]OLZ14426.1 50S ribosomal protein L18 [Sulfobacillus thermosulfidooxidans]OLZ19169.1 50S ribosomal protein L18 [Sulfobacillus thermosulfidooxidans]PSR28448.1 MAG: 50S ribosomal protein L18 [Sulfobacillus thermosulfidooxidans]SMC02884.1 large subunit ribosomal protein L18 [Sulfobacillus thermosulfidooxidans DSM 9293]